jgi:prepilin-type N-terminal cleavage/methylation domain-containing protein
MKQGEFKTRRRGGQAGFTLIEISTAMVIMLVLGLTLIVMLQGHVRFMEIFRQQTFLSAEAPKIGNLLGRMLNQSDHFFVYESKEDAQVEATPVLTSGTAVRLYFKSANQETTARVIAVEIIDGVTSLRLYSQQPNTTWTSWTISNRIGGASFLSSQGILNVTLNGPNGEELIYSGGAR